MKIFLTLFITLSCVFARPIADKTIINSSGYLVYNTLTFKFGNTDALCINDTIYYIIGQDGHDTRSNMTSISHNPITEKPYYCKIIKLVKNKNQNWGTRADIYTQSTLIVHNYFELLR